MEHRFIGNRGQGDPQIILRTILGIPLRCARLHARRRMLILNHFGRPTRQIGEGIAKRAGRFSRGLRPRPVPKNWLSE